MRTQLAALRGDVVDAGKRRAHPRVVRDVPFLRERHVEIDPHEDLAPFEIHVPESLFPHCLLLLEGERVGPGYRAMSFIMSTILFE